MAYYDGQFDAARMPGTLAASAAEAGVTRANYVCVTGLRDADGRLCSAMVCDMIDGYGIEIRALIIVNAAGPFVEVMRRMESAVIEPLLEPSRGTHLAFDKCRAPGADALLIPRAPDGRVLFFGPGEGAVITSTTEVQPAASREPVPGLEEEDYLFKQLAK